MSEPKIVRVPLPKCPDEYIEVDINKIDGADWDEVVMAGLVAVMHRGAAKVTKGDKVAANEHAAERRKLLYTGKSRKTRTGAKVAKGKGGDREIEREAIRLAKNLVNDSIKAAGHKRKDYYQHAFELTTLAKLTLAERPELLAQAQLTVEAARAQKAKSTIKVTSDLLTKIGAVKAEPKAEPLSAKQAGIPEAHVIAAAAKPVPKGKPSTFQVESKAH